MLLINKFFLFTTVLVSLFFNLNGQTIVERSASGDIISVSTFRNNRPSGTWKRFYDNGKLRMKGRYKVPQNSIYMDGSTELYYQTGELESITRYISKLKSEVRESFDKNGNAIKTEEVTNSKSGIIYFSHELGTINTFRFDTLCINPFFWSSTTLDVDSTVVSRSYFSSDDFLSVSQYFLLDSLFKNLETNSLIQLTNNLENIFGLENFSGQKIVWTDFNRILSDTVVKSGELDNSQFYVYVEDSLLYSIYTFGSDSIFLFHPFNSRGQVRQADYFPDSLPNGFPDGDWGVIRPNETVPNIEKDLLAAVGCYIKGRKDGVFYYLNNKCKWKEGTGNNSEIYGYPFDCSISPPLTDTSGRFVLNVPREVYHFSSGTIESSWTYKPDSNGICQVVTEIHNADTSVSKHFNIFGKNRLVYEKYTARNYEHHIKYFREGAKESETIINGDQLLEYVWNEGGRLIKKTTFNNRYIFNGFIWIWDEDKGQYKEMHYRKGKIVSEIFNKNQP